MSELTIALDRILNWLKQNTDFDESVLQPGLTDAEIEEIVKDLRIPLPTEVHELYKWRNGIIDNFWEDNYFPKVHIFPTDVDYGFYSLQKAVKKDFYIFFGIPQEYHGRLLLEKGKDTCRVIFQQFPEDMVIDYQYTSLTNMMLTIAECYETSSYGNPVKESVIWWKYNYDIRDILLKKLEEDISQVGEIKEDLIKFRSPQFIEPLIHNLQAHNLKTTDSNCLYQANIVRRLCAETLGRMGDIIAVEPLIAVLQSTATDSSVRCNAAEALGCLKDAKAIEPLIQVLENNEDNFREDNEDKFNVASSAAQALIKLKAVEPLIELLNHQNSEIRVLAAWALGEIKDSRAIEPLAELLKNGGSTNYYSLANPNGIGVAGWALVQLEATEVLIEALKHDNSSVRQEAAWALAEIEHQKAT